MTNNFKVRKGGAKSRPNSLPMNGEKRSRQRKKLFIR